MRDYKSEYKNYHSKPDQKKRRAGRNGARAIMKKKLGERRKQRVTEIRDNFGI